MNLKRAYLIFILVITNTVLFSQDKKFVDSLIQQVPKTKGAEKVILLTDISFYAGFFDIKLSEEKAKEALNAVTEYVDHHKGRDQSRRLDNAWFGKGGDLKVKAYNDALELIAA